MTDIIAGRVMKNQKDKESGQEVTKSAAEIMAEAIFEGMAGELVLHQDSNGRITYANPLHAVKLYLDYMLKARELAIKVRELKKKEKGVGGGIRIVLPSAPVDPLLRPGQPPRPLRLLGQDPSKPLPDDAPGTRPSVTADQSRGSVPLNGAGSTAAPVKQDAVGTAAESPDDDFAELVEPEDPPQPCHKCDGWGRQRIGFGNKTEPCDRCGGTGTCNGLEKKWDTLVPCEICRQLGRL